VAIIININVKVFDRSEFSSQFLSRKAPYRKDQHLGAFGTSCLNRGSPFFLFECPPYGYTGNDCNCALPLPLQSL